MDAAVKSLCFENKDVDTFPDALLISARCYEEMQEWYRARDVYYEVGRLFPKTDWADAAVSRLDFIMKKELTKDKEKLPIENVFFRFHEDMNKLALELLDKSKRTEPEEGVEDEAYDAEPEGVGDQETFADDEPFEKEPEME
jgi:hypothetical protein